MEIKSYLDNLKVKYKVHKHLPVYTCEESDKLKNVPGTILYEAFHNGIVIYG